MRRSDPAKKDFSLFEDSIVYKNTDLSHTASYEVSTIRLDFIGHLSRSEFCVHKMLEESIIEHVTLYPARSLRGPDMLDSTIRHRRIVFAYDRANTNVW